MVHSVKHLIPDFGSDHDLTIHEFKPSIGLCADSAEPAWDSVTLSLPLSHLLSLSQNKPKNKQKITSISNNVASYLEQSNEIFKTK